MAEATDILWNDAGDLDVDNGDFVIGVSYQQHTEDLLLSHKGDYKAAPYSGIGIIDHLHGPLSLNDRDELKREILLQLQADGMKSPLVTIDKDGTILIDGKYYS